MIANKNNLSIQLGLNEEALASPTPVPISATLRDSPAWNMMSDEEKRKALHEERVLCLPSIFCVIGLNYARIAWWNCWLITNKQRELLVETETQRKSSRATAKTHSDTYSQAVQCSQGYCEKESLEGSAETTTQAYESSGTTTAKTAKSAPGM